MDVHVTEGGSAICAMNFEEMESLISLFVMEKALYEVRYELDNRPDWVRVPLAALLRILRTEYATSAP